MVCFFLILVGTSTPENLEKVSQADLESNAAQSLTNEIEAALPSLSKEKPASHRESSPHHDDAAPANIDDILASFQDAVYKEDWDTVKYLLDDTIYLINTDTGGQTEFLDLMSHFLMGPALNLIISRLVDSLDQVYKIYCTNEKGISTAEEDSVKTVEDVIFQALASIACLEASYDPENSDDSDGKDTDIKIPDCSSKAIFIGTFRDKVTQEEFEERDRLLRKKIEQTEFYRKGLVLCASEKHLTFTLDNLNGGQEEIDTLRKNLEKKIRRNFKKVTIPASWLMFSINIRHKGKRTMTLSECQDMAAKLGITAASLPKALWFLHYRVGILLYYPEIEGFSQLIICDVQVIFFYYRRECVVTVSM